MGAGEIIKSLMDRSKEILFKVSLKKLGAFDKIREKPYFHFDSTKGKNITFIFNMDFCQWKKNFYGVWGR